MLIIQQVHVCFGAKFLPKKKNTKLMLLNIIFVFMKLICKS
jgi:hypothetical protein